MPTIEAHGTLPSIPVIILYYGPDFKSISAAIGFDFRCLQRCIITGTLRRAHDARHFSLPRRHTGSRRRKRSSISSIAAGFRGQSSSGDYRRHDEADISITRCSTLCDGGAESCGDGAAVVLSTQRARVTSARQPRDTAYRGDCHYFISRRASRRDIFSQKVIYIIMPYITAYSPRH